MAASVYISQSETEGQNAVYVLIGRVGVTEGNREEQ
jgi:hypothetical protein